jgi:hypothetical protein
MAKVWITDGPDHTAAQPAPTNISDGAWQTTTSVFDATFGYARRELQLAGRTLPEIIDEVAPVLEEAASVVPVVGISVAIALGWERNGLDGALEGACSSYWGWVGAEVGTYVPGMVAGGAAFVAGAEEGAEVGFWAGPWGAAVGAVVGGVIGYEIGSMAYKAASDDQYTQTASPGNDSEGDQWSASATSDLIGNAALNSAYAYGPTPTAQALTNLGVLDDPTVESRLISNATQNSTYGGVAAAEAGLLTNPNALGDAGVINGPTPPSNSAYEIATGQMSWTPDLGPLAKV